MRTRCVLAITATAVAISLTLLRSLTRTLCFPQVLHLNDLGPRFVSHTPRTCVLRRHSPVSCLSLALSLVISLSVLENATMWHFQQLSRTKLDVTSSKMATVRIPFEVAPASLAVSRAPLSDSPASMHLSFSVRASAKCVVQVLWGVRTDALLEHHFASAPGLSSPRSPSLRDHIPVLRRLSSQQRRMRQRAADLPTFLSRLRRQTRRHRLHDDRVDESDATGECSRADSSLAGFSLEHMVGAASFQSASPCTRFVGQSVVPSGDTLALTLLTDVTHRQV